MEMEEKQIKLLSAAQAALKVLGFCFAVTCSQPTNAAGTLNLALNQQFSFTGCSTAVNVCGTPLIGGLLYIYQTGTVSTRQDSFPDTSLNPANPNPWPLVLDANGRVPMFYLADGSVHVRLTDAGGVVQFDIPSLLVVGPSGGGGGGAGVDATAIASTGDIKFRMTSEPLPNWVKLNAQKIGAPGAAGADLTGAQYNALYNYLWVNCPNTHCPVLGGRGANGNADFNAGKNLQLPDWRGRGPMGLDDMGVARANIIPDGNVTSAGDTAITPGATGGQANHTMTVNDLVAHAHAALVIDPGHSHGITEPNGGQGHQHTLSGFLSLPLGSNVTQVWAATTGTVTTNFATTGITINGSGTGVTFQDGLGHPNTTQNTGSTTPFNVMQPFVLGSWYMRL
jgi:hypothetical protein